MRPLLIGLALFAALSAHAAFEFDPPAPTNESFVFAVVRSEIWRDGCIPVNPKVTRSGSAIDVTWTPREGGCTLALQPWSSRVPLGMLAAGAYDVAFKVNDGVHGMRTLVRMPLIVDEVQPALFLDRRVVSTAAPGTIGFSMCGSVGEPPQSVVATVGGIAAAAQPNGCITTVTLPSLPPGPADLFVRAFGQEFRVINAVRYIDPAAAPDPSLFERVLVPILFNGPGAFGSMWETRVEMVNTSTSPVEFVPEHDRPLTTLAANASTSLSGFGNRPSGLVLFLPRGSGLHFGSIIRDVSREADDLGAEVGVVRERDTSSALVLANVPFDPRYRVQLRIYELDGIEDDVFISAGQGASTGDVVKGPCQDDDEPCNSNQPAYVSLDLAKAFPALAGKGRRSVVIRANNPARRLWAFVTVTNNATQRVTVITPQ